MHIKSLELNLAGLNEEQAIDKLICAKKYVLSQRNQFLVMSAIFGIFAALSLAFLAGPSLTFGLAGSSLLCGVGVLVSHLSVNTFESQLKGFNSDLVAQRIFKIAEASTTI